MGRSQHLRPRSNRHIRNKRIKTKLTNIFNTTTLERDNKGEFKISSFIIALLLATLAISIVSIGALQMRTRFGQVDDQYIEKYNVHSQEINTVIDDLTEQVRSDDLTVVGFFTQGTYAAAKVSTTGVKTFSSIVSEFARDQPEIAIAVGVLVAGVVTLLMFLIVSAAFRWGL